ncbi:MAG: hypothetical protein HY292_15355 [Planctomycetes bacterium]|nr:hypothetical protein [Planctomycetota bacterium]
MARRVSFFAELPVLVVACTALCGATGPELPTRREIQSTLLGNPGVVFVYGAADPALAERYRHALTEMVDSYFGEDEKVHVVSEAVLGDEERRASTLYVIGTPAQCALARTLGPEIGVAFEEGAFRFAGRRYADARDTITVLRPSPFNSRRGAILYTGNSDETILRAPFGVLASEDYSVRRAGRVVRSGLFSQEPATRWAYDPARDRDLEAEREAWARSLRTLQAGTYRLHVPPGLATDERLQDAFAKRTVARRAAFANVGLAVPEPADAFLYPTLESKAKPSDDPRYASLVDGALHSVFDARFDPRDVAIEVEAALSPKLPRWLRIGLSVRASGRFEGWSLDEWSTFLDWAGMRVDPVELSNDDTFRHRSYWFSYPSAALFVRDFAALLRGEPPRPRPIFEGAELDPPPVPFMRGACIAHTYSLDHGYVSRIAGDTMRRLHDDDHVDWFSITPFGYMAAKDRPEIRPGFRDRSGEGLTEENDEAVWAAIDSAHAAGAKALLAPHLWVRGAWCGDVAMKSDADWRAFFEDYRALTLHYAMLARVRGADAFAIGKELVGTTRVRPDDWRALIADVRRVFPGPITYESNWGEEFETLPFWDALDFAGLNEYRPLATTVDASDDELRAAARAVADGIERVAKRIGKPIVLTEVGFPSHRRGAIEPWKDSADKTPAPEIQARAFRALFDALDGRPWLGGLYIWKVFTNPTTNENRPTGYPIAGKPAETAIRDFVAHPSPSR